MKNFNLKHDSILYEDTDGNYYLLNEAQSIQVSEAYSSSLNIYINCRKIEESQSNNYIETDDLFLVQKRATDLKPTLLLI